MVKRLLLWLGMVLVATFAVLGWAAPAAAHSVAGVGATNFHTVLSSFDADITGLQLSVVDNGSRLELSNRTGTEAVVRGYSGEPYARVGPEGVFLNDNSPATYLNGDRYASTRVPEGTDPQQPPRWRKVSDDSVYRWHDHRVHWMLKSLPPQVIAAPNEFHTISQWTVTIDYGQRSLTAAGALQWVPGPSPWLWIAATVAIALGVVGLAYLRRPRAAFAATAVALVVVDLAHGLGVAAATSGTVGQRLSAVFGSDATSLLLWPLVLLAAAWLARGHTRPVWVAGGVGLALALTLALDDAPAWWRSSAPTAFAPWVNRASVAAVVGLGVGLAAAAPLLVRRHATPYPPRRLPPRVPPNPTADEEHAEDTASAHSADPAGPATPRQLPRRQLVGYLGAGAIGALAATTVAVSANRAAPAASTALSDIGSRVIPFYGRRQSGIIDPVRPQAHGWVAAFDLLPGVPRDALQRLLRRWTDAAARLSAGPDQVVDGAGIPARGPAALTTTFGFGRSLFAKINLSSAAPEALVLLPAFAGDDLDAAESDGDLALVVCSDDRLYLQFAVRWLRRLAADVATVRWELNGFNAARGVGPEDATGRNLMGQLDGTNNPHPDEPDFDAKIFVAAQSEPAWMRDGSYLVVRRIRMLLDEWEQLETSAQELVIGRRKDSGAPLSGGNEFTLPNFGGRAASGAPAIPEDAHIRLAAPAFNNGAAMLRRGFSYVRGAEAGLLFLAWQADPRRGFIPVQAKLAGSDALQRYIRHETSALFAVPGGIRPGGYVGQSLLEP